MSVVFQCGKVQYESPQILLSLSSFLRPKFLKIKQSLEKCQTSWDKKQKIQNRVNIYT